MLSKGRVRRVDPQAKRRRIWTILDFQGRTMVWLAEWVGVSEETVRFVRYGMTPGSEEFWAKAAKALQTPVHILREFESDAEQEQAG